LATTFHVSSVSCFRQQSGGSSYSISGLLEAGIDDRCSTCSFSFLTQRSWSQSS